MPVELRKRKAPVEPALAAPSKKKSQAAKPAAKAKSVPEAKPKASKANGSVAAAAAAQKPAKVAVGDSITLADFGGEIETQGGEKTSLQKLVEKSEKGVVLFTYPRASTPGCMFASILCEDLFLINRRHDPSLPLPRLIRASHCNWVRHLWPLQR
jgi:thioredoxin-dependent peroxiredoxin